MLALPEDRGCSRINHRVVATKVNVDDNGKTFYSTVGDIHFVSRKLAVGKRPGRGQAAVTYDYYVQCFMMTLFLR